MIFTEEILENEHMSNLKNSHRYLWIYFWLLNVGYIVMVSAFITMGWCITTLVKYCNEQSTFIGYIVSYNEYFDGTSGLYHLDAYGETLTGSTCTYHDYFVGTQVMKNIIIEKDLHSKITWFYDTDTGNCGKYDVDKINIGFLIIGLGFVGFCVISSYIWCVIIVCENFTVRDNHTRIFIGQMIIMIFANIIFSHIQNNFLGIYVYWFFWVFGIIVNCRVLYMGLKNMNGEYTRLMEGHRGTVYGSQENTQCTKHALV